MSRLSYARVLVEVNLLSDLPYSIEVTLPNDSLLHQQVVYETLPCFFESITEPLVTLLQLAPNPHLLMFQANSRLTTLPLFPKVWILFSTIWDLKKTLLWLNTQR
jgi:hypothetical protein